MEHQEIAASTPEILPGHLDRGPLKEQDPHLLLIEATEARIRQLYPELKKTAEQYTKLRLAVGHELSTLQKLHAKPGYGDFVSRLNLLGRELGFKQSTGYALIREYKIAAGLKPEPEPATPGTRLSNVRKDDVTEQNRSTPEVRPELERPSLQPETGTAEAKTKVEVQIPLSQLQAWDDAILLLQARPGYEGATQSELIIEAVIALADLTRLHQQQAREETEQHQAADLPKTDSDIEAA